MLIKQHSTHLIINNIFQRTTPDISHFAMSEQVGFIERLRRKRKENAAENFAVVRHIALNLLKNENTLKRSIKGKRLKAGWDNAYLAKVLEINKN